MSRIEGYTEAIRDLKEKGIIPPGKSLFEVVPGWRRDLVRACRQFFPDGGFELPTNLDALIIKLNVEEVPKEEVEVIAETYKRRFT